jgi:predicted solute-binding protein
VIKGELKEKENHPAVYSAIKYLSRRVNKESLTEAFASCAIENNRLAEVCLETIRRIKANESVNDRYLLGLAWTLKELEKDEKTNLP